MGYRDALTMARNSCNAQRRHYIPLPGQPTVTGIVTRAGLRKISLSLPPLNLRLDSSLRWVVCEFISILQVTFEPSRGPPEVCSSLFSENSLARQ